jgi:hypothetical protein
MDSNEVRISKLKEDVFVLATALRKVIAHMCPFDDEAQEELINIQHIVNNIAKRNNE